MEEALLALGFGRETLAAVGVVRVGGDQDAIVPGLRAAAVDIHARALEALVVGPTAVDALSENQRKFSKLERNRAESARKMRERLTDDAHGWSSLFCGRLSDGLWLHGGLYSARRKGRRSA